MRTLRADPLLVLFWLLWVNPTTNAREVWTVDPMTGDSTRTVLCEPGAPLADLDRVRVWRWPIAGGLPTIYTSRDARGREGAVDSVEVPGDAHYYVTALDIAGNESCASNIVYLGPTTSAPAPESDRIVELRWYDVHGHLVRRRKAPGIYFYRARWRSGRIDTGKSLAY